MILSRQVSSSDVQFNPKGKARTHLYSGESVQCNMNRGPPCLNIYKRFIGQLYNTGNHWNQHPNKITQSTKFMDPFVENYTSIWGPKWVPFFPFWK